MSTVVADKMTTTRKAASVREGGQADGQPEGEPGLGGLGAASRGEDDV